MFGISVQHLISDTVSIVMFKSKEEKMMVAFG